MENTKSPEFVPNSEQDPREIAMERWGVKLADDHAVLLKLQSLQGKMPDVADLSNLWRDYQEQTKMKKAA